MKSTHYASKFLSYGRAVNATRTRTCQQRLFSTSRIRCKSGGVPAFTEVSTPELQELLSNIRKYAFINSHLEQWQKDELKKMRARSREGSTEKESLLVTVAGEEFRIAGYNDGGRRPKEVASMKEATRLMKDKRDWDNLPALLRGYRRAMTSNRTFDRGLGTAIRNCTRSGRQEVLLECIRQSAETGVVMKERTRTNSIFQSFVAKMYNSGFDLEETKKALLYAEQAAALLENPEHAGSSSLRGDEDPRTAPEIIGVLMQLAAVHALKHLDGKDKDGKVASYLEKFMNTPVALPEYPTVKEGSVTFYRQNTWLVQNMRLVYGMEAVLSVLPNGRYAQELRLKRDNLYRHVRVNLSTLTKMAKTHVSVICVAVFNQLFPREKTS